MVWEKKSLREGREQQDFKGTNLFIINSAMFSFKTGIPAAKVKVIKSNILFTYLFFCMNEITHIIFCYFQFLGIFF